MEVIEAVRSRRSIRSFKPDPLPREVLEEILETCRWAPSSRNTQPWEFAVLGGKVMEEVKACLMEKVKAGLPMERDMPEPDLQEPYLQRAILQRDIVDTAQFPPGTEGLDEKRAEYWIRGGCFHDAPNGIIVYMDKHLYPAGLLGIGILYANANHCSLWYIGTDLNRRRNKNIV